MSGYFEYYQRTIQTHLHGLKLVGGGTGLGKTSNIPRVVVDVLSHERKAIYVANRLQLLEEMAEAMNKTGHSETVVMLPRDVESVKLTMKHHRRAFESLIDSDIFHAYAQALHIDLVKFRRACKTLDEIFNSVNWGYLPKWQEETAEDHARAVLKDIRAVIANAKEQSSAEHIRFLDDEAVQSLFPFIRFLRHPQARVLLVSLQKLFYGFFNGVHTLTASDLEGYVIFADEFDFLENDLINLIARSPQIDDPFRFVEFFYREMQRHKWQLANYPVSASEGIRNRIGRIMSEIDSLPTAGIHYPDINQFISTQDQQDVVIFRTSHTVISKPVYLTQTERAFDITFNPNSDTVSARRLLSAVSAASEQILTLLKKLDAEDPRTYKGLIQDCYRNTTFISQIAQIGQFPRRRPAQPTQLGSLLDAGYSMYDIHYLAKATDPEEVELRHYAIYTTPEKFMATLAGQNLVFALSATADIERCVNHFSLEWLGAKDGVSVLPVNTIDQQLVSQLNDEKAAKRENTLHVLKLTELDAKDTFEKGLKRFIVEASKLEGFGSDTKQGHVKQRVERFFAALLRTMANPAPEGEIETHLMFLNTYAQIEFVFSTPVLQQCAFYQISQRVLFDLFQVYDLVFQGKKFVVVFYNAEKAKRIRTNDAAQEAFQKLFHEGLPVVVVTQYLSAGNGVNLQYRLADGRERDFLNLHLLEIPYYYFNVPSDNDTSEERVAKLKENLWYLAKLHAAKYLSEAEFKARLGTLHRPYDWNQDYQHHDRMYADYRRNTLASLIQALGRIERIWEAMPSQHVILCREAYHTFQHFLSPEYDLMWETRGPMMSHNLRQLLEQVRTQVRQEKREIRRNQEAGLAEADQVCRQSMTSLLERFENVRLGADQSLPHLWRHLREAALKHDFADKTLNDYGAVFTSPYFQEGTLFLTPERLIIPGSLAQPDTWRWQLSGVYNTIGENKTVREYFARRGYEMDFSLGRDYGFVPYFYQAVLMGAIGEEAIAALLTEQGSTIKLEDVPNQLFEVADLKIAGQPWYIDCKNYSDYTLALFSLTENDFGYRYKLNGQYFEQRAIEKWHMIATQEGAGSRLIYINIATSQERLLQYYRCEGDQLRRVHRFNEAQVIVVPGALDTHNPNIRHDTFVQFLQDLETHL